MTNKDLTTMINLMAKLVLQNSQNLREIQGCVWYTFIVSESTAFVKAITEAGQTYAETVKGLGGNHSQGPPHVHKWLAAVEALIVMEKVKEDLELTEALGNYHSKYLQKASIEEVACSVKFFKFKAIYKGKGQTSTEYKMHLALANQTVAATSDTEIMIDELFCRIFKKCEFEMKVGPGPAGQMERLVQQWVEKMKK